MKATSAPAGSWLADPQPTDPPQPDQGGKGDRDEEVEQPDRD